MSRILIVEDDVVLARALKNWLERERLQVTCAITAANARRIIANEEVDMILSDLRLPDGDGIELLEWMKKNKCRIPLIIMTQHAEVSSAIRAMKAGAEDYLPKPIHPETLYPKLNDVLLRTRKTKRKQTDILQRVSPPIREVERRARLVAVTDMSVLIRGENGSGKELVADLIHRTSARDDKPFVPVDCGAIPKELSAAEFFGYVKGAFTGAVTDKTGVFHAADGGTLFLDEVGNLPYEVQTNLLRVLQERRYRPIGGRREYACDVRIVAATNENIERAIAEGHFREDLYHRLNEFTIELPPLHPDLAFVRKDAVTSLKTNVETTGVPCCSLKNPLLSRITEITLVTFEPKINVQHGLQQETGPYDKMQIAFSVRREKRKATPAEKLILDSYLGFGAIKCIANPNPVEQWHKSDQPLYPLVQLLKETIRQPYIL